MDGQASTLKPSSIAAASATATTRSLKEWVGLAALVLHPQAAQAELASQLLGVDQAGPARLGVGHGRHVRGDGEQAGVTPDAGRSCLDGGPVQLRVVVADLQRPEALGAGVGGAQRVGLAAFAAAQAGGVTEPGGRGGSRGTSRVMCSRGEAFLLICPSGRMAEGRTWHLSREWPRGHTSRDGCRGFTGPYPSTPLDERYEVVPATLTDPGPVPPS